MNSKYTNVGKYAAYKGHRVFLYSKDETHYQASFTVKTESGISTDWMLDMQNVGKGEYQGSIPLDDPDLKIEE